MEIHPKDGINKLRGAKPMNLNKKTVRSILIIAGYVLLGYNQLLSQPYYFYFKPVDERKNISVYRFDLSNGTEARFTNDIFRSAELDWDPTQTWLYVYPEYGSALIINIAQPSTVDTLPSGRTQTVAHVMGVFFVHQLKNFYVTWTPAWGSDTFKTYIYSSETFDSMGTVDETVGEGGILSRDGTKLYYVNEDTLSNVDYLYRFSTVSNTVLDRITFSDIGPQAHAKVTEDGKDGELLVRYYYPSTGNENTYYFFYDLESKTTYAPIHFPVRSYAFLSGNTDKIIIEQANFDTTRVGGEYRPGNVGIFDSYTGTLLQRLKLPPEGKILIFDNYPNMMYYYIEKGQKSINLNLTELPTIGTLSSQNVLVGSGAFTLSVNGKNFTLTSKVQLNGTNRATTFVADTLLQATIRAGDVDTVTTAYIAVRDSIAPSSHATTDSLALNIASVPSLVPILNCITQQNDTTYTAWFGYENDDTTSIFVPAGSQNKFSPIPNDRTQPTVFEPGKKDRVFSVVFNGKNLTWNLNGNEVIASKKSPKCN